MAPETTWAAGTGAPATTGPVTTGPATTAAATAAPGADRLEVGTGSAEQTRTLARRLGARLRGGDVVVLSGELGAGKTTFVQGLALGLGVTAPVTSPTFVLARHQRNDPAGPRPGGPDLVHVDAYRLQGALELDDLDLDSDLDTSVVVVEWGEGLAERLSPDRVEVTIGRATGAADRSEADERAPGEPRTVRLDVVGLAGRDLLAGLDGPDEPPADLAAPEAPGGATGPTRMSGATHPSGRTGPAAHRPDEPETPC